MYNNYNNAHTLTNGVLTQYLMQSIETDDIIWEEDYD